MVKLNQSQQEVFTQTSDPTVNEDLDHGYQVSNIIVNTNTEDAFICVDSTNGAAVWRQIKHGGSHVLDQQQYYAAAKAGADANTGKSEDDPLLTLSTLMGKIGTETPSSTNQFMAKLVDGGIYTGTAGTLAMEEWTHLFAPSAQLEGNYNLKSRSMVTAKRVDSTETGATFNKNSGSDPAYVSILGETDVNNTDGLGCTSGRLGTEFMDVTVDGGDFIRPSTTNDITSVIKGKMTVGIGAIAQHNSTGELDLFINRADCGVTTPYTLTGTSGINTIMHNRLISGGSAFNAGGSQYATAIINYLEEVSPSTVATLNRIVGYYKRSGDTYDGHMLLSAGDAGIGLQAHFTGGKIRFTTIDGNKVICEDYFTTGTAVGNAPFKYAVINGTTPAATGTSTYTLPDSLQGQQITGWSVLVQGADSNIVDREESLVANSLFHAKLTNAGTSLSITVPAAQTNVASRTFQASLLYRE